MKSFRSQRYLRKKKRRAKKKKEKLLKIQAKSRKNVSSHLALEEQSFKVYDYQWSNTDGKPRPLGQLFYKYKQCSVCEVHPSDDFSNNHFDAVNAGLDSIMGRLVNGDLSDVTSLVQVVFRE